jgi:hypothetical protein
MSGILEFIVQFGDTGEVTYRVSPGSPRRQQSQIQRLGPERVNANETTVLID